MNYLRIGCQLLLFIGLFLLDIRSAAAAERVVFSFSPAANTEISYTVKEAHHYDIPGKKSVQQTTSHETLLVEKAGKAGVRVRVSIGESRYEEDGMTKPVQAVDAMTGRSFRLNVDKGGRILAAEGMAELAAGIRDSFENPRVREVMAGLWTEEKLRVRFTDEWNSRIAAFSGRTTRVGESWYGTQEVYMPFIGAVTLYRKVTIVGTEKLQGQRVARAVFNWFSDPSALGEADRRTFTAQEKSLGTIPNLASQGVGIVGKGEVWIEPRTMTVLKETQQLRGAFAGVSSGSGTQPPASFVELTREIAGVMKPGKKD